MDKYNTEKEIWKDIKGYEGLYQISSEGRVKSLKRCSGYIMKQTKSTDGYLFVNLLDSSHKRKSHRVSRLVAINFIENPENKPQVNHINGIVTDNRISNLEWSTPSENMRHAVKLGLWRKENMVTKNNGIKSKLSDEKVTEIKALKKKYPKKYTYKKLASKYGVKVGVIQYALHNR